VINEGRRRRVIGESFRRRILNRTGYALHSRRVRPTQERDHEAPGRVHRDLAGVEGIAPRRLHSFMCNAFGPGGVRAQRPDARRHRSPRRNGGCVAIQGDSALRHGHVKKTGQWCTQNRATDPGVALLGDPGRVGEKGREGLQVGLQGPGDRSHAMPVEDWPSTPPRETVWTASCLCPRRKADRPRGPEDKDRHLRSSSHAPSHHLEVVPGPRRCAPKAAIDSCFMIRQDDASTRSVCRPSRSTASRVYLFTARSTRVPGGGSSRAACTPANGCPATRVLAEELGVLRQRAG
jgi:hypothetical protein